jgi:hypothetical protein
MWQRLRLDRRTAVIYYGLASFLALGVMACTARPAPLAPAGLRPIDPGVVRHWVAEFMPAGAVRYELQWIYETQQGRVRGRAAVRFAPPDSVRFDYRAPFGRSGAAVLIGDSVLWAEPEEEVATLIPIASLFWAALGLPRYPPDGRPVLGEERAGVRIWRFGDGRFEKTYVETVGPEPRLQMELRQGTDLIGTTRVSLDSLGTPSIATITFPRAAARFTITVNGVERLAGIDPAVWREP